MNYDILFALINGLNLSVIIMNIPPVLTELRELYGGSYTELSVLISALLWTHAAMQIPAGVIVDRLGIRRSQVISLLCLCLGNGLACVTPSLLWGVVGRLVAGVGTGLGWLATLKMLAVWAPGGRGGAYQAFFAGIFSLGSIGAYLLLPIIVLAGWRWVYLAPVLMCLPMLAMASRLRPAPPSLCGPPLSLAEVVSLRPAWLIGLYHALSYGAMLGLGNWVPSLLAEAAGLPNATKMAWGGALVMLVSGLARITGGFVVLRLSSLLIAHGSMLILVLLFACLAFSREPAAVLVLGLLGAWFGSFNFGALFQIAARFTAAESLGTLLGFVNFLGNLGAVAITLILGWSKDNLGAFGWGFVLLAPLGCLALVAGRRLLSGEASLPKGENTCRAAQKSV